MSQSCVTCALYMRCQIPEKGPGYSCSDWASIDYEVDIRATFPSKVQLLSGPSTAKPARLKSPSAFSYDDPVPFDDDEDDGLAESSMYKRLDALMADAMLPNRLSPPDFRIDDSDLPLAANFYEFTTGRTFLNHPPYPKQLIILSLIHI